MASNLSFRRESGEPLRDQIVEVLRDAIITCRLKPGAVLNERELAEQLGVSKTPVREALSLLNHEQLVEILPRQAYVVSAITVRQVHEAFQLRLILESAAVELVAAKIDDDLLAKLDALVDGENPRESDKARLTRNLEFHTLIAEGSDNERLARLIRQLLREMPRLISVGYIAGDHDRLLAALRAHDAVRAGAAIREHILGVRDKALAAALPTDVQVLRSNRR